MTKEEFNWFWKDTTKEGVLNQFYYEHIQLREEIERINKAIEYINDCDEYDDCCNGDEIIWILKGE